MLLPDIGEFGKRFPKDALRNQLLDTMAQQSQVLNALQRSVMKIRMVPVDQMFRRFPRLVRDTAKACGKDIVMTEAAQRPISTRAFWTLSRSPCPPGAQRRRPRNRDAAGTRRRRQTAQGTIRLNAYHQANQVVLEVTDDGRGMNIDSDRRQGNRARVIITPNRPLRMSDQEKLDLVFQSGVTTAERSPRSPDAASAWTWSEARLARLKGTVAIDSAPGDGTTFRLTVPLDPGHHQGFAFPRRRPRLRHPAELRGRDHARHGAGGARGRQLGGAAPARRVATARPRQRLVPGGQETANKFFVVIVGLGDRKFGLVVNRLVGEEELVIKAIQDTLVATELVSGACILGDGTRRSDPESPAVVERLGRCGCYPATAPTNAKLEV